MTGQQLRLSDQTLENKCEVIALDFFAFSSEVGDREAVVTKFQLSLFVHCIKVITSYLLPKVQNHSLKTLFTMFPL